MEFSTLNTKKINSNLFSNQQPVISQAHLKSLVDEGLVEVYTSENIRQYSRELVKGLLASENKDAQDVLKEAKAEFVGLRRVTLKKADNSECEVFVKAKAPDNIEKGDVDEALGYGDNALPVTKTGKEIKAALTKMKEEQSQIRDGKYSSMLMALTKCGSVEPTEEVSDYMFGSFKDKISVRPKMYSWQNRYSQDIKSETGEVTPDPNKALYDCRNSYNNCVSEYIRAAVGILKVDAMIRNIDEKKSYTLKMSQALAMGF